MTRPVELPLWALVLLCLFAAASFAAHFLLPSVRWVLRRWAQRVVARVNTRLARPVEPFKMARRTDTVMRLVHDPEVARAIAAHAREQDVPEEVAFETARRYAREVVPSFSAILYFGVATRMARWLSRHLYRVRVEGRAEAMAQVPDDATIVFVMNHRSNADYVLVTWLLSGETSLSYAVGEWARRWPLGSLIRAMGGFFVRRRDLNPLYRKVLSRYVQIATAAGVTQAVFPEGRLSRDGALQPPKLGILSYIVDGADLAERDVVFVPVALNYDRVIEDRRLVAAAELPPGQARFRLHWWQVLRYLVDHVKLRLTRRGGRFGRAGVAFGRPLSLRAHLSGGQADPTAALGEALMARLDDALPVLPVAVAADAILSGARDRAGIAAAFAPWATRLGSVAPRAVTDPDSVASETIDILAGRGLLRPAGGAWTPNGEAAPILAYYRRTLPSQKMVKK